MDKKVTELNSREKMLLGMNEIIMSLNNEECKESWLMCGVPDGSDEEEILEMANDDNEFIYCTSLFLDIIRKRSAYEDGIYISKEIGVVDFETRKKEE